MTSKPVSSIYFKIAQYIVGTPIQKFTFSRAIASSVAAGSNRGSSTTRNPPYMLEFICTVWPVV